MAATRRDAFYVSVSGAPPKKRAIYYSGKPGCADGEEAGDRLFGEYEDESRQSQWLCLPSLELAYFRRALSISDVIGSARHKGVRPGDLILFSGKAKNSDLIEGICGSMWSHVAIVYRDPRVCGGRVPLMLESASSEDECPDVYSGKLQTGVRGVRLAEALARYKGHSVAVRRLRMFNLETRNAFSDEINAHILHFIEQNLRKPYEKRWLVFFLARYPWLGSVAEDHKAYFCSQLVAECYKSAGLIPDDPGSKQCNQYLPNDFSSHGGPLELRAPRRFLSVAALGPEEFVDTCIAQNSVDISSPYSPASEKPDERGHIMKV